MSTKRVRYREDQTLKQKDLQDEQAYRIALRRRHNIAHHGWGIVHGLSLTNIPGGIQVLPGFAIDGYGRELVVTQLLTLDETVFKQFYSDSDNPLYPYYIDVWLTYCLKQTSIGVKGEGSRFSEEALLKLACNPQKTKVNPFYPWEVPPENLSYQPYRESQEDPEQEWPVYLGLISIYGKNAFIVEKTELAYATLTGATINAPWGDSWLQISDEERGDNKRYSISLPDSDGNLTGRLTLNDAGDAKLEGNVYVKSHSDINFSENGNLDLYGTANEVAHGGGIYLKGTTISPDLAASWQLYRTKIIQNIKEQKIPVDQMRFETFNPGEEGDPARYELVIGDMGYTEVDGKKKPNSRLTVRSNGNVIIDGDLLINGKLIEGAIPANFEDKRFLDAMLSGWTDGLTIGGTEVEAYYELPLHVDSIVLRDSNDDPVDQKQVPFDEEITYKVQVRNDSTTRTMPIVAVLGEFRNKDRILLRSETLEILHHDYPVVLGNLETETPQQTIKFSDYKIQGAVTLTVKVVALGVAQNTVEKQVSTVLNIKTT